MNKKLLPNRSSKAPAADALTKVRQAVQLLNEALGDEIAITDEDYKGLRRIADKLKRITDDVFEIAKENEDFVKAVKATGKKQLIIAGVVTEVCVAFPALSALEEDYEVFIVTDASGTFNEVTRNAAWSRMESAGAQLMSWFGVACELHRDWRNDVEGLGKLFSNHIPNYRNLMTSYDAIQAAQKAPEKAK